jgi:hypothetical protein
MNNVGFRVIGRLGTRIRHDGYYVQRACESNGNCYSEVLRIRVPEVLISEGELWETL